MASIVMAAAPPGLLNVVMDIKPLDSGTAIVTGLPASDTEIAGIYVSDSHIGTETGLHRVTVRQGSKILAAWYVDLTNTGNRDIAYDSDRIINTNNDKNGYNVTSGQVDDVIQPVTCGGGVVGTVTGNVDGSVGSVIGNVGGSVGSVVNNVTVGTILDSEWKRVNEQVTLAEGYGAVGSIASVSQILNLVLAILQNPQYVNFEFRARRLNGTSEAAAFQMDDDTNPTQHNRIR